VEGRWEQGPQFAFEKKKLGKLHTKRAEFKGMGEKSPENPKNQKVSDTGKGKSSKGKTLILTHTSLFTQGGGKIRGGGMEKGGSGRVRERIAFLGRKAPNTTKKKRERMLKGRKRREDPPLV